MASTALSILSGVAAAAAGLAGEKVSKTGAIPGLDLATIIPALLGSKAGGASGVLGTIASAACKSGLLNASNLGKLAELAGGLISSSGKEPKTVAKDSIAGLAAAIVGGTGSGANLASIATMAAKLAKPAQGDEKALGKIATDLGSTLASKFGVSFGGTATAVKGLSKVLEDDTKTQLFTSILKGIAK